MIFNCFDDVIINMTWLCTVCSIQNLYQTGKGCYIIIGICVKYQISLLYYTVSLLMASC